MRFFKLTFPNSNDPLWVDAYQIIAITPSKDVGSTVYLRGAIGIDVIETPEEILEIMSKIMGLSVFFRTDKD